MAGKKPLRLSAVVCLLLGLTVIANAQVRSNGAIEAQFSALVETSNLRQIKFLPGRRRQFTGLLVDRDVANGNVYVAGVNELLQFDANLDARRATSQLLGPLRDGHCRASGNLWNIAASDTGGSENTGCTLSQRAYDTYVKNMQMYPRDPRNRDGRVLVCFNAYAGLCEMRNGTNVTRLAFGAKNTRPPCVVARRLNLTDMFVFGRSPGEKEFSMFHARSYAPTGGMREQSSAGSIREVEDDADADVAGVLNVPESRGWCPGQQYLLTRRMYDFTLSSNRATAVSVIVSSQFRDDFFLDYRYAFKWATRHAYFVTVQKSLNQAGFGSASSNAAPDPLKLRRNDVPVTNKRVRYEIRLTRACFEEQALLNSFLDVGLRCATEEQARDGSESPSDWPDYAVAAQLVTQQNLSIAEQETDIEKVGERAYLLVLAKFSESGSGGTGATRLCAFRMSRIVAAFADTVNQCAARAPSSAPPSSTPWSDADTNTQVSYADGSTGCNASQPQLVGSGNSWCAFRATNDKPGDHLAGVRSTQPLFADVAIRLAAGVDYTSLIAKFDKPNYHPLLGDPSDNDPMDDRVYTAFIGDNGGQITKVSLSTKQPASTSTDAPPRFKVADDSVVSLALDYSERSLYVLTPTRVGKLAVDNLASCSAYQTCEECVANADASCGWCVANASCTTKAQCQATTVAMNLDRESLDRFFFYAPYLIRSNKSRSINMTCPSIWFFKPARTPSGTYNLQSVQQQHAEIQPNLAETVIAQMLWNCQFKWTRADGNNVTVSMPFKKDDKHCVLPSQLYEINPAPNTVVRISLSLATTEGRAVTRPYTILAYDCSAFTTCRSCVELSPHDTCAWYVEAHGCYPIHLPNPIIPFSNAALVHDPAAVIGSSRVPQIEMPANKLKEVSPRYFQLNGAASCPTVRSDPSRAYAATQNENVTLLAANLRAYMNVSMRCVFVFGATREPAARYIESTRAGDFSIDALQTAVCNSPAQCNIVTTNAILVNSSDLTQVKCGAVRFQHIDALNDSVSVYVFWNGSSRIDAAGRIDSRVELETYRCGLQSNASAVVNVDGTRWMGTCTECVLRSPARYSCTYCTRKQTCTLRRECPVQSSVNSAAQCSPPTVRSVSPSNATLLGGTFVEVLGTDLGAISADVLRIELAGVPCQMIPSEYITARRIVCQASPSDVPRVGPVKITVRRESAEVVSADESSVQFVYMDVRVSSVNRRRALQSGGALVEIAGEQLNAGLQRVVRIVLDGPNAQQSVVDCTLTSLNATRIICETSASRRAATGFLEVLIDGRIVSKTGGFPFDIVERPRNLQLGYTKTLLSGALDYEVSGDELDVVDTARMQLLLMDTSSNIYTFSSLCIVQNATRMTCVTPAISLSSEALKLPAYGNVSFQFGDAIVRDVAVVSVYGNPEFHSVARTIDGTVEAGSGKLEYLTIDAKNVDGFGALRQSDIKILVGKQPCNITTLTAHQITCLLPLAALLEPPSEHSQTQSQSQALPIFTAADRPEPPQNEGASEEQPRVFRRRREADLNLTMLSDSDAAGIYSIEVYIGRLPALVIGHVRIGRPSVSNLDTLQEQPFVNIGLVIGILGGFLFVVIVIVIIVIFVCLRGQHKHGRHSSLNQETDALALRDTQVARVAKQTYYELQTAGDSDENVLLGPGVPIPFLDYRAYCMHFMFPTEPYTHPVVRPLQLPDDLDPRRREQVERGVKQFNLLLSNKHFVLLFVRTIEQEVTRMSARVHFAALLSACLHSRLDHFTDILKTLLADLIKRFLSVQNVHSGIPNHPRLLLRQTESVAEKMLTIWFAFLLYKYIRCSVGEPLYQLYYAILQRIHSGPVDAIHGDAKYCLNEIRLLRQDVSYSPLHCIVMTDLPEPSLAHSGASAAGVTCSNDARTPDGGGAFETPMGDGKQLSMANSRATSCDNVDEAEASETEHFLPDDSVTAGVHQAGSERWAMRKHSSIAANSRLRQYNVKLLDVDTITQAKEKILETVYRHVGMHDRPSAANVLLFHLPDAPNNIQRRRLLRDEDDSNEIDATNHLRRLNTLSHYDLGATATAATVGTTKTNAKMMESTQATSLTESCVYLLLVNDSGPYLPSVSATLLSGGDERTPVAVRSTSTGKSPGKAALLHSASATPVCQEKMKQRSTVALSGSAAVQCQSVQPGRRRGTFDMQPNNVGYSGFAPSMGGTMQSNVYISPSSYSAVVLPGSQQHSMSMAAMPTVHSQYVRTGPLYETSAGVSTLQQQAAIAGSRSSNDVSTLGRSGGNQQTEANSYKLWHLVRTAEKLPSEIFTPGLLMVKTALQRYIDGFFSIMLNTSMSMQQNAAAYLTRNGGQLAAISGSQPNGQALSGSGSGSGSCLLRSGSGSVGGLMVGSLSGLIYNGSPSTTVDASNAVGSTGLQTMSSEQLPSAAQISACVQQTLLQETAFPLAIKFMFDFFDEQAVLHNITDPSVVHTWKSNALPLRFWVNLLLNPEYIFDVPKASTPLYACLSVISQMYITACSADEHRLTKDDPSSKLLFSREITLYRKAVEKYYQDIRQVPAISDQEMTATLLQESRENEHVFYTYSAAYELLTHFVANNRDALLHALRENEPARKIGLPRKFEQVCQLVFDWN